MSAAPETRSRAAALDERYLRLDGTVYLTGVQALVRMLFDRARHDRGAGLDSAGYVSGYEGSPLAGYDLELARKRNQLAALGILHQPGLNEELAATAVSGTQLAGVAGEARFAGVTGTWYGKAPGLDRAMDALRHANLIGTAPAGGAVALVGDDPAAKSSTVPSASESALADLSMPTFYPADPAEILVHGLHAVELSRASGLWSAMKVTTAVADGACTAEVGPDWQAPDMSGLPGGLRAYRHRPSAHLLGPELAELERGLHATRLPVAVEYIRRSGLNTVLGARRARVGLVAAGKTYLDLRQALTALGLTGRELDSRGIRLLKLGVLFPLEPGIVTEFARGLDEIVVVEEKRGFIEDAVKAVLYGQPGAPAVQGKRAGDGAALFSAAGELDPDAIARGLAGQLTRAGIPVAARPERERITLPLAPRTPYFCSGCPHNSSTKVAPGTLVGGGIGCHAMVLFMPEAQVGAVTGLSQMGGEGAQWIGLAPFVTQRHLVQNLGDGTFTHSGSLAVRAAVAAGVNITFKLLRNSAVAMTGGQDPVGALPLPRLLTLLAAEGVRKTVVTSDDPGRLKRQLGPGADVRHRDDLLAVQQELAAVDGVTVLVHDQECAAEKRRKRRRGTAPEPAKRLFINERVCEGCGDCGAKSNCLSVQPVTTELGRKTRINQSSCNLDYSCLAGDCPSFLAVTPAPRGAGRGTRAPARPEPAGPLPEPAPVFDPDGFTMRITGVGGTGVVTIAQILATAAAAEGRHVRALDQTGLAQKGGAVVSDLKIGARRADQAAKLAAGECDLYLGCDSLVATDGISLRVTDRARTVAVVSTAEVPTGHMVADPGLRFPAAGQVTAAVRERVRSAHFLDAAALAVRLFGDEQYANMILVGAAYQAGALPIGAAAIESAIGLNGVAVDVNVAAFRQGRQAIAGPAAAEPDRDRDLAAILAVRVPELTAFQDEACGRSYASFVERVRAREAEATGTDLLARAVAENLFKLTAYKDEYEVARLSLDPRLAREVEAEFGRGARYRYQLHPPVLRALGMHRKISLGPWARPALRVLIAMRRLRGTPLDPFGRTGVRRLERALISEYRDLVTRILDGLTSGNLTTAVELAGLPDMIRGYEEVKLRSVGVYRERLAALAAEFPAAGRAGGAGAAATRSG
ncbi:MAG TPA: indolepyruvate ferredoxin oxidoreductase family protein [Trebonia sp.]|jgi:indolepyruvate ferredoxin oxidoreductase|nr:indolepyruvate ferredoxin oxidoreductase family protein [Trebonia sp.]